MKIFYFFFSIEKSLDMLNKRAELSKKNSRSCNCFCNKNFMSEMIFILITRRNESCRGKESRVNKNNTKSKIVT